MMYILKSSSFSREIERNPQKSLKVIKDEIKVLVKQLAIWLRAWLQNL